MIAIPESKSLHITPIQIRFNDIDIAAHVNNAVYQNYLDLAKTHYFNSIFKELIDWKNIGLVLAHIELDYYKPTYLEDKILVESTITKIGSKSFDMIQVVRKKGSTGEDGIKCVSRSVMVAYHYKGEYSFTMPKEWVEAIQLH